MTAVVHPDARIGRGVKIGAYSVVGPSKRISIMLKSYLYVYLLYVIRCTLE